jgi:hypothetical protein
VPRHDGRFARSEFALDDVEVCAAHATGMDATEHLAGGGLRLGELHAAEWVGFDGGWGSEDTGFHESIMTRGDGLERDSAKLPTRPVEVARGGGTR